MEAKASEAQLGSDAPDARELTGAIAERLAEVLNEPVAGELRRLSSGASRETFAFATPSRGELVVQIARGRGKIVPSPPQVPLLQRAAQAGVPVPAVVAHGERDEVLGPSWAVVQALSGTTDPKAILAGDGVPDPRALCEDFAAALASIHSIPTDSVEVQAIEEPLALLRAWHDQLGEPHPAFELAFRALESERPPALRHTLVHGDFRIGNLMVGPSGLTGVLDWELAHVGDPVEDLGWMCVPAWRFARPDRPAAGLVSREELLDAYERHAGWAVDPAALRWWELAGTLRWGVICVMQAFTHLSGATRSVEHAVIGRRACEVEWDLLELLDPAGRPMDLARERPERQAHPSAAHALAQSRTVTDQPSSGAPVLHDRPTALELLEAARGALGEEVLPQLQGRAAFQLRVVLRALGMVRRELEHRSEHDAIHRAALASVGCADERELAGAIREGMLGPQEAHVLPAVRAIVRAKLEVANPRYLQTASTQPQKEEQ